MGQEWYYQHNGQKHGPVSGASLKQLAAAGKLQPTDLIWKEGMAKGVPARSVKGLFPAAPAERTAAAVPTATAEAPPAPARVEEVVQARPAARPSPLSTLAGKWRGLPMPAKLGIVGGGGVLLLAVVAVPLLLLVLALGGRSPSGGGPLAGQAQAGDVAGTKEPAVDLDDLVNAYAADEKGADARYKGKRVRYSGGSWGLIGKTTKGTQVQPASSRMMVVLDFTGESKDTAWKRKKGKSLQFSGICEGLDGGVLRINECQFEDGGTGDEANPVAASGYQSGKTTRIDAYNLICQVARSPDLKTTSFSGVSVPGQDGRRYCVLAVQADYAAWAKTFGDITVEDFVDDDGTVLTKSPGVAWGKWTLQCSDGPLTVIGCVMEASQSPTKRKRVQITKVGLF
jgi:hypothetical protein